MLPEIVQRKQKDLEQFIMPENMRNHKQPLSLRTALTRGANDTGVGIIAEIKRASPSKGWIKQDLDVSGRAIAYENGGADAISVLTDEPYFKGSNIDLQSVRAATKLPILRKDFIVDERQIEESYRIGADAILLIAAVLSGSQIQSFTEKAQHFGLEVLVEVHNEDEIQEVFAYSQPELIGINNRNLKTFETSIEKTKTLADYVPKTCTIVSESGIHSREDASFVRGAGAKALLVGEHLVKSGDPREAIRDLKAGASEHVH